MLQLIAAKSGSALLFFFFGYFGFCQVLMNTLEKKVYSRQELFSLKWSKSGKYRPIPAEIELFQWCHAGANVKAWKRRYMPFLPTVITGNVNSAQQK